MADLSIKQKKEWAKQLFCEGTYTQKAIADKVDVSEKTMSKWVEQENWESLRKSLLVTKQEQLANLYEQLSEITAAIKNKPVGERYADSKQADIMVKITASIEQLEEETNMADIFEVGKQYVSFIQTIDFEGSKVACDYYDIFIQHKLKTA